MKNNMGLEYRILLIMFIIVCSASTIYADDIDVMRKAAEQGDADAQLLLSTILEKEGAVKEIKKSAEQERQKTQFNFMDYIRFW